MGLLPPLRRSSSAIKTPLQHSPTCSIHTKYSNNDTTSLTTKGLPRQAQELKDAIIAAHPGKPLVRFSFSRMKHVATPPVAIPEKVANPRALSTLVGGKNVAFTMSMWRNAKKKPQRIKGRKTPLRPLDHIDEYVTYWE
uniref:Uncharacterized protein n=1 Tax=Globisporangium ultimum (strain ATCC 200006 / CBS 805.95 / DAOM BR144) TaxID=431595 RepID=K3WDJ3_GLOUD